MQLRSSRVTRMAQRTCNNMRLVGTSRQLGCKVPLRCVDIRTPFRVSCTLETQHLFQSRLQESGWRQPQAKVLHPVAADAWQAIHTIYSMCYETPLVPAPWLDSDSTVLLKCENKQATGSFKARGAAHKILGLSEEQLAKGVITASTGNHALAVVAASHAASAQHGGLRVPVVIYLPRTASPSKVARLSDAGAEVVQVGSDCLEAELDAREAAAGRGAIFVSPYNDVQVAGGQGSIAVELLMQLPRAQLDAVFVPVGGGGLIAGIASVLKAADPSIRVVGCQPAASDVMRRSVDAGQVVQLPWQPTLSEATAGGVEEGAVTLEPCARFVDDWVLVSEEELAQAVIDTISHSGMQIESASGLGVAAFQKLAPELKGKHSIIIASGSNISQAGLDEVYRVAGMRRQSAAALA